MRAREFWASARALLKRLAGLARAGFAGLHRPTHGWFAQAPRGWDRPRRRSRRLPEGSWRALGQPPRSGRRRRWVWAGLAALCSLALLLPLGFALYCLASLPVDGGLQVDPAQRAIVMEAADGETFATRGVFRGAKLTVEDLPRYLGPAMVAIEDRRFYAHHGIDLRGTLRALWRDVRAGGSREGGSTLTQQLVRLTYLSADKTLRRKVQEALLSLWLETQLSKDEILLRYLNTAYFGAGSYGADAAAHRYFGKKAKDLTLAECAMLAGLVRAPSQLAPTRNFGGAKERADTVIQAMVDTGAITPQEADKARSEQVNLATPPETPPGANYFVDMVASDVRGLPNGAAGDLTLGTTLNLELQRLAEGVVERRLAADGARKNASQGALVAMAPDGAILAMVGGRDYEASQFNRAIQAKRQPGSLFKLFVYLTAFAKGYTPDSVLVDQPVQIGTWQPENASSRFKGRMDLRSAFADSVNTVAAQLGAAVGIPAVIETAKRLGVQSDLPNVPSLALGTAEVSLLEMTRAYAAVAAGAPSVDSFGVRSIRGANQQALYTRPPVAASLDPGTAQRRAMMIDLLQAVVNEGTGKAARIPRLAVGGKTGTTQDFRDAWFIGFTHDLVVGVWVGNDDNSPMKGVVGGDIPAAIWHDFVERAEPILAPKAAAAAPVAANATPARAPAPDPQPADAQSASSGAELRGYPEVIDTGTLAFDDRIVHLQGVTGEGGRMARQLARYMRRREVVCGQAAGDAGRCRIGSEDLSTMILAAGGARASDDAPPELLAAEEQARSARLGIWRYEQ